MKNLSLFVVALFILWFFSSSCHKKSKEPVYQSSVANLDVFKVKVTDISSSEAIADIQATGILSSDLESKPSFKTGGVIDRTYFKEGDRIQKGALLARLNLSEIKAQAEQAKKAVEKTTRDLTRAKNLFADSVATLEQVQNAQTAYDMSIETLKIVEFNQSYSKVIAPESGIVIKQLAREGEIVGPRMPVCVVMGIGQSHWIVKAALTDKDWARIKKGDKSKVRFEAFPDQEFEGQVSKVADMANAGTATLDAEIKLKTTVQKLAAGLISNITIHPSDLKLVTKITIPIEALVSANEGNAIVFVPKDGIALRKTIRIDKILGKEVTISSGLEGVSKIITSGAVYLQDGDKIEIVH